MSAVDKYLRQYAEPEAQAFYRERLSGHWSNVLVVPAYGEPPSFLDRLNCNSDTLLVLVVNHPDTDPDASRNDPLRQYLWSLPEENCGEHTPASLRRLPGHRPVLIIERPTALAHKEGVGLARKIGCDVALALAAQGCIQSSWIHCSDADAILPDDYFRAADAIKDAAALTYRFQHLPPTNAREAAAIALYERYLQSYVDGLREAGSPYAFHTVGSCIAVTANVYAKVRGFPRRAAGEDFYLLNKAAKQGAVVTPECDPIRLSARLSQRAPFGTGPALIKLLAADDFQDVALFYHPRCYADLAAVLDCIGNWVSPDINIGDFQKTLVAQPEAFAILADLGIAKFFGHARQHCSSQAAFLAQFHQWFDGFKTLKFIHAATVYWPKITEHEYLKLTSKKKPHPGVRSS